MIIPILHAVANRRPKHIIHEYRVVARLILLALHHHEVSASPFESEGTSSLVIACIYLIKHAPCLRRRSREITE